MKRLWLLGAVAGMVLSVSCAGGGGTRGPAQDAVGTAPAERAVAPFEAATATAEQKAARKLAALQELVKMTAAVLPKRWSAAVLPAEKSFSTTTNTMVVRRAEKVNLYLLDYNAGIPPLPNTPEARAAKDREEAWSRTDYEIWVGLGEGLSEERIEEWSRQNAADREKMAALQPLLQKIHPSKPGSYDPKTPEEEAIVAEYEETKLSLEKFPLYRFREYPVTVRSDGTAMVGFHLKAEEKDCARAQAKVISCLEKFGPNMPGRKR